eukprot:m.189126 g.189126  ORF g.189126 m.189126 type:complete len:54 (+) comp24849_c0_seq1:29-190(+)
MLDFKIHDQLLLLVVNEHCLLADRSHMPSSSSSSLLTSMSMYPLVPSSPVPSM